MPLLLALVAASATGQAAVGPAHSGYLFLSVVSGTYADDQRLSVEPVEAGGTVRYSIRDPDGREGPWIPFREPVLFSAASGEERDYRVLVRADSDGVELERRELALRIDKRPPAPPRILPDGGTYWEPVSVSIEHGAGDRAFYTLPGDLVRSPVPWEDRFFAVGRSGELSSHVVQAYTEDAAGNRSAIVTARYSVDARDPVLQILSPAPGTFANPQALALSFRNVQWVRYTIDGSDPASAGIPYTGPVLLRAKGSTTVRVAAQPRGGSRPLLRREQTWVNATESGNGLLLDTESGTYAGRAAPRILSSPEGSLYYTLWEKTPGESDYLAASGISLAAGTMSARAVVLRLRSLSDAGTWGAEYRYFYFIGPAGPMKPSITIAAPEPLRGASLVEVNAPADALVAVTVDGSMPKPVSPSRPGLSDLLPAKGAAWLTVKAIAFDASGAVSPVVERRIAVAADAGSAPVLVASPGLVPGSVLVATAGKEARDLVFEMTSDGAEPPAPGSGSPRLASPLSLSLPFGMKRTFRIKCAAMDTGGRVLATGETLSVSVNRKPPGPPVLTPVPGEEAFEAPVTVSIGSTAKVAYSLASDGTAPGDPLAEKAAAGGSVFLKGIEGSVVSYRLKLLAVDDEGNATEVYGPFVYTLDLRTPRLPALSGIADGGRYGQRRISPALGDSPWKVRYAATTDGATPPDPDLKSPELTNATEFSGGEGGVTTIRLKLLAVSRTGSRTGERRNISFIIDLKPPEVPQISGVVDGGRYARAVVATSEQVPADVSLFYSTSTGEAEPVDPVAAGQLSPGPLTFDAPDGVRRDFTLRVATLDGAGNRSLYDRTYRFSIDRGLPDDPRVNGIPETGISAQPVTVTLTSIGGAIFYELTENGSTPRLPTNASPSYVSPLLLPGRGGAAVTYRLLARTINDLGTASRAGRIFTVTVDRTVPPAPNVPRVQYLPEDPSVAYLTWDAPASGRLLYRLSQGASGDYELYAGTVSVPLSATGATAIIGEAVVESPAGTRGSATAFSLTAGARLAQPAFRGIRDGGISTQKAEVRLESPAGETRYELATDGEYPPAVTASSPLAPEVLTLDAADGETLAVRIAARAFDPSGAAPPSGEAYVAFTIDKTPPDPPVATGIDEGGYYQEQRHVTLLAPEGTIYYRLAQGNAGSAPAQIDANRYRGDIALDPVPGEAVSYHIVAYTVDQAGNRSRETRTWSATIDQKVVYVTPGGSDYADGSRSAPLASLGRALQIASSTSRKTVFMAAGEYSTAAMIDLEGDIAVIGGLDPVAWTPLGLDRWSVLTAAPAWRSGDALVSMSRGQVTFKGIELRGGNRPPAVLLDVEEGSLGLENVTLTLMDADTARGLQVRGGAVTLANCTLQASAVRRGALIVATAGTLDLSGTQLTGPRGAVDFACLDGTDMKRVSLTGCLIAPGGGAKTRGIRVLRSQLQVAGSRLLSGGGSVEAVALESLGSDVTLENLDLAASREARSPTAVLSVGGSLLVEKCTITVAGSASAVGLVARGGEVTILRSTFRGSPTPEFLSLLRIEDAAAVIADSLVLGGDAGQSVCVQVKGGTVDLLNNTIVAGTGTTLTSGILVQGERLPRMVNNIVVRSGTAHGMSPGATEGAAVMVLGARAPLRGAAAGAGPVILTNCFHGWKGLLHVDYARELNRNPLDVPAVEALNGLDGDPFGGTVQGNITENPGVTFKVAKVEEYRLSRGSACLDAGTDLSGPLGPAGSGEMVSDFDGKQRPGAQPLADPGPPRGWDIGAYEFSE